MKYFVAAFLVAALYGCGGGGDSSGADLAANPVVFSTGSANLRMDRTDTYSVTVASNDNKLTFAGTSRLDAVRIQGTGNTITLESGATATAIELSGSNNVVALGSNVKVNSVLISGANGSLDVGSGDTVGLINVPGSNTNIRVLAMSANITRIELAGSNAVVTVPAGYAAKTTIVDTGANNKVVEQ